MGKITFDQIQLFMSLFKGRNDIYAKRWEKDGKNGYSPEYEVNWTEYNNFKAKGGTSLSVIIIITYTRVCISNQILEICRNYGLS